jgi:hypothetical protein
VTVLTVTCLGDVRFVNIGGIVDRHLFKVMFGLLILVELLIITCLILTKRTSPKQVTVNNSTNINKPNITLNK